MAKVLLSEVSRYCDRLLAIDKIPDYSGAQNGLQVSNRGQVTHIAAAVDAGIGTIRMAIDAGADLLVVHHGLFWAPRHPWTGTNYEIFRLLMENDLAVYSAHLPLDIHRQLGNNAGLAKALGLSDPRPFFFEKEQSLGLRATTQIKRDRLIGKVGKAVGVAPTVLPGGPEVCRRVGIVTGGAGGHLKTAADEGVDTFITGEGPHWTHPLAEELEVNVIYAGHYATETFGVKALAGDLARKYKLPWEFLDRPSGL